MSGESLQLTPHCVPGKGGGYYLFFHLHPSALRVRDPEHVGHVSFPPFVSLQPHVKEVRLRVCEEKKSSLDTGERKRLLD